MSEIIEEQYKQLQKEHQNLKEDYNEMKGKLKMI